LAAEAFELGHGRVAKLLAITAALLADSGLWSSAAKPDGKQPPGSTTAEGKG
jgi:hypothetical protein